MREDNRGTGPGFSLSLDVPISSALSFRWKQSGIKYSKHTTESLVGKIFAFSREIFASHPLHNMGSLGNRW